MKQHLDEFLRTTEERARKLLAINKLLIIRLNQLKELIEEKENSFDVIEDIAEFIEDAFFYAPTRVERDLKQLFSEWADGYINSVEFKEEIDKMLEQIKKGV